MPIETSDWSSWDATDGTPSGPNAQPKLPQPTAPSTHDRVPLRHGSHRIDQLLWRIRQMQIDERPLATIGVTGVQRQDGASTIAVNLAIRAADHAFGPVLLVDANVQAPHLHELLHTGDDAAGLVNVLTGECRLGDCLLATSIERLSLVPGGRVDGPAHDDHDPALFEQFLADTRSRFSMVVFDLPVVDDTNRAGILAAQLDGNLLVVRAGGASRSRIRQSKNVLDGVGAKVLGAVVNQRQVYIPKTLVPWLPSDGIGWIR